MSKAKEFTIQYLDALKDILQIENVSEGKPTFIPDRVNKFTIMRLREAIRDLYGSSLKNDSLDDLRTYGKYDSIPKIQTTGIGYSEDFELMVKMGLLMGHRIVLWDTMLPGIIFNNESIDLMELGTTACDLLLMYPIVQGGGLVYLPHPANWSKAYQTVSNAIQDISGLSNDFLGFMNARALAAEEYPLHPFMTNKLDRSIESLHSALLSNSQFYGEKKLYQHDSLRDFLVDPRFIYIKEISSAKFYDILNSLDSNAVETSIRNKLADELRIPDELSPIEKERKRKQALSKLADLIPIQNENMINNQAFKYGSAAGAAGAGLGVVGSILIMADATAATAIIGSLIGSLGAAGAAFSLIEKILGKQDENILYQFFTEFTFD